MSDKRTRIKAVQYGTDARVGCDASGKTYISHKTPAGHWSRWRPAVLVPR